MYERAEHRLFHLAFCFLEGDSLFFFHSPTRVYLVLLSRKKGDLKSNPWRISYRKRFGVERKTSN